jgi:superfamily II DNA or RNA helicase
MQNNYLINIFERYTDLKKSNKTDFDHNDLWKIFEYYSCIQLTNEFNTQFYEYDDISPNFKELNKMSRNDTGIDLSNLTDTIVQCKLRNKSLNWKECSTFFGSQIIFDNELNKKIIRWDKLIITRNSDCILAKNLLERKELFHDKPYDKQELIEFCENLILNPPVYPISNEEFKLRDYQLEAIDMINNNSNKLPQTYAIHKSPSQNVIINLPTGTGKNSVVIYSLKDNCKYLILVPRIILMEQLKSEIIKHKPSLKNKIQLIGDGKNTFNTNKNITICVFNSIHLIENHCNQFEKIYIDEAHHINKPIIYEDDDEEYDDEEEIESVENNEDELVNVKNYTKIIKSLSQYNNNVYLSATIDKTENFEYYSQDIRKMIELNYLCDYQIHVPIFKNDITNTNICKHLLKNYRNIIIYCNSRNEGKKINELMNKLQNNSSLYIDCKTPKKQRNENIEKYKSGEIPFLVNVHILVEGFDAPISKGVCFMHLPKNKTTLIQIIGRCLRLHSNKTIANIILPFSSNDDENNICNFLKIMSMNDSRIRQSYENKNTNGYISIEKDDEEDTDIDNEEIEFKYNLIYDSMCILQNGNEIWMKRLDELKEYIDEHNKRPTINDDKRLCSWLSHQLKNYKNKQYIISNEEIYNKWTEFVEEYKQYFITNEEQWYCKLQRVKDFMNENNKRPTENDNKILCLWIRTQLQNYKNKTKIMSNGEIRTKWTEFVEEYKQYFMTNEELWYCNLQQVRDFMNEHNKKLSKSDNKILCLWIRTQLTNYKNKIHIMTNEEIYNEWTNFIEEYKQYFMTNEEQWYSKLQQVRDFMNEHNKRLSKSDNEILFQWISHQLNNYKNKIHIMTNEEIYNEWTNFIEEYKHYMITYEEIWYSSLQQVKDFMNENKKRPSKSNEETKILGNWISTQIQKYKNKTQIMSNEEIYNKWTEFVEEYKEYMMTNEELWYSTLHQVKDFINENNKKPYLNDDKRLCQWISDQIKNYKKKINVMSNEEIYNKWSEFVEEYKEYFISNEEIWYSNLQQVKDFMNENNKRPSKNDDKILSKWLSHQITNYKNKSQIMSNEEIYNKWSEFVEEYKQYFIK